MNQTVRLAVQEQYLRGETMIEKWQHAQALGFDAIELRGAGDGQFAARLPELREAAAAGVPMPTVCVEMLHFVGDFDPAKRADALVQMKSQLSVMAEALGMEVLFHDVVTKLPLGNARMMPTLDELLEAADVVTLHVPETPLTHGMMGAEQFARMKPGAVFINASRGTVVDIVAAFGLVAASVWVWRRLEPYATVT